MVQFVEREVREKGRQRRALWHASVAGALEKLFHHGQHVAVDHPPRHFRQDSVMPNRIEVARQIHVDHAVSSLAQSRAHFLDCLMRATSRPCPIGAVREVGFEDWFQDEPEGTLDHAVSNRRNRNHADFAALLGNLSSTIRPRVVRVRAQFLGEFRQKLFSALPLNHFERLGVGPRGSAIALGLQVRRFERVQLHDVDV
jgi:hypothetical protein